MEFRRGTTGKFTGTPPTIEGQTVELNSVVTTGTAGTIANTVSGNDATIAHGALVLGDRIEAQFSWLYAGDQFVTGTAHAWVLDRAYTHYGDLDDVQNHLGGLVKLSPSSKPSPVEIAAIMEGESFALDARLAVLGYVTPVEQADSARWLGTIVAMLTAAKVYRRMAAGRDPAAMANADQWVKQAEEMLSPVLTGKGKLQGAMVEPEASTAVRPAASSSTPLFTRTATSGFISERY